MVSAGGTIEGNNGNVWVRWRWLGADGGGGGGWQSEAAGGKGIIIFKDGHCFGAPRSGGKVFSQWFFFVK